MGNGFSVTLTFPKWFCKIRTVQQDSIFFNNFDNVLFCSFRNVSRFALGKEWEIVIANIQEELKRMYQQHVPLMGNGFSVRYDLYMSVISFKFTKFMPIYLEVEFLNFFLWPYLQIRSWRNYCHIFIRNSWHLILKRNENHIKEKSTAWTKKQDSVAILHFFRCVNQLSQCL